MIIQLKDLQDIFNNLEVINFKYLETIRDLQAKVEALEKETVKPEPEPVSEVNCNDCDYKAFNDS